MVITYSISSNYAPKNLYSKFLTPFFSLFLVFLLSFTCAFAQPTISTNAQSFELRVANLEQQYDAQIIQILSNYFDRKKFFVDVNINAEIIDEAIGTSQSQVVRDNQPNLMMPGLPFLTDDNLRERTNLGIEPEKAVNENTIKTMRLVNLSVNIYADTSLTVDQLELMRFITGIAVKTNESRGDVITISQLAIPDYTERPEPVTEQTINPPVEQPNEPQTIYESIVQYIPALVLMLLFGLTILFSRFFNKPQQAAPPMREFRENFKNEAAFNDFPPRNRFAEEATTDDEPKDDTSVDSIVETFFNKPEEIASIFRFWISEEEGGVQKAANVILAVDKQLLRTLKKELHPEDFETLAEAVIEGTKLSAEERLEIVKDFNSMLQSGAKETISATKRKRFALFKFLDHISDHHILTLLGTEEPLAGAFILQYLPDANAAEFLEQLDKDIAAKIMLHMATLNNLSNEEQHKISTQLFDKAMDLVEAERSEQYGAEHLYPILERLPVNEQKRYIDELKATGSIVGAILEKQFITIDKLPELSEEVIKRAVRTLNTETLLDAVTGLDPSIVDKILAVRPKREQRLLRMELDELNGSPTPVQRTEYAKALLMNSIRKNVNDNQK